MTAVLVAGVIAVVGAVVARVTWRRPGDERHSIESHRQTLDTLRSMADRRAQSPRDESTRSASASAAPSPAPRPRGPVGGTDRHGDRGPGTVRAPGRTRAPAEPASNGNGRANVVFVDAAASGGGDAPRVSALTVPKGLPRARHRHRRGRGNLGARLLPVVGAVAVLGAVAGVAVAFAPSRHPPAAQHRAKVTTTSAPRRHRTTVTTVPTVVPTPTTASTADYPAPSASYTVALRASGQCWVEATETATGTVVWTGTLTSGQARTIASTGSMTVRLGAANDVAVTLNGTPVVLPAGFQSPFNMTFQAT